MGVGIPQWNRDIGREYMQDPYLQAMQNQLQNQMCGFGRQQSALNQPNYNPSATVPAPKPTPQPTTEKKSMFKEISADIKAFIMEHRGVIYFIAFALIVDHFVFRGAFKARLQGMADRIVTKVEEKIQ